MVAESPRACGCNLIAGCYYGDDVNVHVWRLRECCFALVLRKALSMYLRELPASGIPHRSNSPPVDCQRVESRFVSYRRCYEFTQRGNPMSARTAYQPKPVDKFSFGLWTLGNRGRDPFGDVVRPTLPPVEIVKMLAEVGAWGVNLHDNDLVPIDATSAERDRIVKDFQRACKEHGLVVPMATVSLFYDPVFRDGAFT